VTTNNDAIRCTIYRSPKRQFLYLYLASDRQFDDLPAPLQQQFQGADPVLELLLNEERKLAQADVVKVIAELQQRGFYLQMPPDDPDTIP